MQGSEKPHEELRYAEAAAEAIRAARSIEEFERQWKEFLRRLERVWSKMTAHFGRSPKWSGWCGKIEAARKADQMLSYLVNARGAEEHTVNEIRAKVPGGIGINAAEGKSLFIERMEMRDGVLSIHSPQALKIDFLPARMTLLPVANRGRTYAVPAKHLNQPIDGGDVQAVAQAALASYRGALADAESFFVK